jgi:hypothetical protein
MRLIFLIGGGIFSILILASLLTMLPGFICSIFGKKTIGSKLIWFGALCGVMAFSFALLVAAWIKRSWVSLIMLAAALLIPIALKKKWKQKDEQRE